MNRERIVETFIEMAEIYSPSTKEKEMAEYMIDVLEELDAKIYLDEGYKEYGGNAPVIFAKIEGNVEGEGITLSAHMDVVEPNEGAKLIITDDIIKTDGTTTLGADDKAGIASIIETLRVLKEEEIDHQDIYLILTTAEEFGMVGIKHVDWDKIPEDMISAGDALVVDSSGSAGRVVHSAPSHYIVDMEITGKKSHAGLAPEEGVNAIQVASLIVGKLPMGRIDEETTANISHIHGEFPSNVVPDKCRIYGEIRGHSEERAEDIGREYEQICKEISEEHGAKYTFEITQGYPALKPTDGLVLANKFAKIYEQLGLETELVIGGGGSDSNVLAGYGYNSIILGVGAFDVHTTNEYLVIEDMVVTTEAMIEYIRNL